MSIPSGVSTCQLNVGSVFSPVGTTGTVQMQVFFGPTLVHEETGWVLMNGSDLIADNGSGMAVAYLPHVDQGGFKDEGTQTPVTNLGNYKIIVTRSVANSGPKTIEKYVSPVVGQNVIDFDKLPSGLPTVIQYGTTETVTSVNGRTGAVDLSNSYVPVRSTPPDPAVNPFWADTSTTPPSLKVWNGTAWVALGGGGGGTTPGDPDETPDATVRRSDTMTGTDGSRLGVHNDGGGISWTERIGTWILSLNRATSTTPYALATSNAGQAEWTYKADVRTVGPSSTANSQIGLVWNVVDNANYLLSQISYPNSGVGQTSPSIQIYRVTSDAYTLLAEVDLAILTGTSSYTPGMVTTMRLDKKGVDVTVWLGGVEMITISDTQGSSSNIVGARIGTTGTVSDYATLTNVTVQDNQALKYINWPHTEQGKFSGNPILPREQRVTANNTTLATALTSGTTYTSITTAALTAVVKKGDSVKLTSGSNTKVSLATANAAIGATSISVRPFVANFSYPSGTQVGNFAADSSDALATSLVRDVQNNRWALAYSMIPADGTEQINMGVAYSDSPLGPFTKSLNNPVLLGDGPGAINGGIREKNGRYYGAISSNGSTQINWIEADSLEGPWTNFGPIDFGPSPSWVGVEKGDPYLRINQDGKFEIWFGASVPLRDIGKATHPGNGGTSGWVIDDEPTLLNNGISTGVSFSAASVYVPEGKEGEQMLIGFDIAPRSDPERRSLGQAITLDGGDTWHYRLVSGPDPTLNGGIEAGQNGDSDFEYVDGKAVLYYGACALPGLVVGIGGQGAVQYVTWDGSNLRA